MASAPAMAAQLDRALGLMLAIVIVMAAATYTRFYFVSWLGERVTADLRRDVFDHLLRLPPEFFELTRTGEVISRLTNDTTMLQTVIGSSASMAVRNLLLLVGGLVMLALTSAKLTLLVLLGVPLVVPPIVLFGRRVRTPVPGQPGSPRRCRRVSRRGAARDPHRPGLRSRSGGPPALRRARRGCVRDGAAAGTAARVADRRRHLPRLRRGRRDPVDRRSRRRVGSHYRRPAVGVRVLCGDRRELGRHAERGVRRCATRRRRERAAVRAAGGRAGDPRAGQCRRRCRRPRAER